MRSRLLPVLAAATGLLALAAGLATPSQAATVKPSASPEPYVMAKTERYGSDPQQYVTVMHLSTNRGPRPTAYFIHGGSWVMGSPGRWSHEAKVWAERGWTVVNMSYRLDVDGRLMLADVKTVTHTYRLKPYVDAKRQILVGDSAGGHLATLLAAQEPARFRGVVAWSPVISPAAAVADGLATGANPESVQLGRRAAAIWGFSARTTTALSYVSPRTPPLWVAASAGEWLPWTSQGATLCTALGSRCHSYVVPGSEHGSRIAPAFPALEDASMAWAESAVSR